MHAESRFVAVAAIIVSLNWHLMLFLNNEAALIMVAILLDDICQVHVRGVLHILDVTDVVQIVFEIVLFNLWL